MSEQQGAAPLPAGTVVDSFTIDQLVRQDRYSACYSATDNGRRVLLREFLARDYTVREGTAPKAREADDRNALRFWMRGFLDQAQQLSRLQHPALPRVLRVFEANGTAYVASEPVAGENLETLLEREGVLDESRLRKLLTPVLDALELAHTAGILHRDLRPANLVMRPDGSGVLLDFAVLRTPVRLKSGLLSAAGTAPYAAPEEATPGATPGPANDVYGIGAISYRALCGVAPTSAGQRMSGVALVPAAQAARVTASDTLLAAVDAALSLSLDDRPSRIAVFRDALQAGAAAVAVPGFASGVTPPRAGTAGGGGGGGALKIAIPVVALVVAAGVGYLVLGGKSSAPGTTSAVTPEPAARDAGAGAAPPAASPALASTAAASASAPAAAPADAAPPGVSPLDRLAQDLLVRDRKAQTDAKAQQDLKDKAERDKKLKEAAEKALAAGGEKPGAEKSAEKSAEKTAEKAAEKPAEKPARAAAAAPTAEESAAAARTRALEEEIARLKAERSAPATAAAPAADSDAQRAAREKAARDTEVAAVTERERQKQIVARALKSCRIPAPTLSAAGNLTYDTAMRVPGAERVGSAVRLPAFTTADGDTQQFEVMPDSCARKVN